MLPKTNKISAGAATDSINAWGGSAASDIRQFHNQSSSAVATLDYKVFTDVWSSYGTATWDTGSSTATITKVSSKYTVVGYVHFYMIVSVPAMSRWQVTYNYSMKFQKTASNSSQATMGAALFYFGADQNGYGYDTNSMTFQSSGKGSYSSYLTSRGVCIKDTTGTVQQSYSGAAATVTYTNNTNATASYCAHFGFYAFATAATSYANAYTASCTMSVASLTRTAHLDPRADKASAEYNKVAGSKFTFFYNDAYMAVTSISYKRHADDEEATDVTSEYTLVSKACTLYEVGIYTFTFSMTIDGYGWSALPAGAHRTVTVSIVPAGVDPPGITNTQQYTGEPIEFMLTDFDANMFAVEDVSAIDAENDQYVRGVTEDGEIIPKDEITANINRFQALKVGRYAVTLSINDTEHYRWKDGDGTGTRQVFFEIIPRELQVVFDSDYANALGNVEYTYGEDVTVTVTDDSCEDETISLYFYYDDDKGNTLPAVRDGKTYTVTLPPMLTGAHTLYAALNGNTDDNANYTLMSGNSMPFTVIAGAFKPNFKWTYFENGKGTKETFTDGALELNYKLSTEYRVELVIPLAQQSFIQIDETRLNNGYETVTGSEIGTYISKAALISTDTNVQFKNEDGSQSQSTIVTFTWNIAKGDFDLSGVKWEYYYTDSAGEHTADYNPDNPPQYNEDNYIYIRLRASSLPAGLTLADDYTGERQVKVGSYTTVFDIADLVYDSEKFNDPDENADIFTLNWEIAQKNIYKAFQKKRISYENENGSGSFFIQYIPVAEAYEKFIKYVYSTDAEGLNVVTLEQIKADADPMNVKTYYVTAMIDQTVNGCENVTLKGTTTKAFKTGSDNAPATATISGEDGSETIAVIYDGLEHFGADTVFVQSDAGTKISEYELIYYYGSEPDESKKLAEGELPTDAGEYCLEIILTGQAEERYTLARETFTLLIEKRVLNVTVDGREDLSQVFTTVYDGKVHYGSGSVVIKDGSGKIFNDYKVVISKDSVVLPEGEQPLNAGSYTVKIVVDGGENNDLSADGYTVVIERKTVTVPMLTGSLIFNGDEQNMESLLDENWNPDVMGFTSSSVRSARNAGSYKVVIKLKEELTENYIFVLPDNGGSEDENSEVPAKAAIKYALTDDSGEAKTVDISPDGTSVTYEWIMEKFVLDVSEYWKLDRADGAALNLPDWIKAMTLGDEPALDIGVAYYDLDGNRITEDITLKSGDKYLVAAYINSCEEEGNFEFKNPETDATGLTTSPQTVYTVPQAKNFKTVMGNLLNKAKDFMIQNWMGLPIWAWAAIALAVLIMLIIIIAVARKRRKTKAQREEIKAKKAEEKARKEEERRLQKEKLEAERELARAKQEAELEKIRAQAQAGMAGAGMATMAMQQPQIQQPMSMPVQQVMPVQAPVQQIQQQPVQYIAAADNSVLAEIRAELAEIKARQNMGGGYSQPMQYAQAQYNNDPVAAAELIRLKAENEAHMRAELERARSEAERARMEAELARVRAESRYATPAQQFDGNAFGGDMQKIGALAVAIWKSMNDASAPVELKPAEVPQIAEESASTATAQAVYPPDAIVTTTTTVDTTQKPLRRERDDSFVDVDGFYDNID
ncbi:MAG: hypothetical protein K2N22_06450 [Clostridia bacterium]|nr:hypothetical protein [Clostridia bacterium]